MLIFDGDYPMAYSAIVENRDLILPIEMLQQAAANTDNIPVASLPEMRRGGVTAALVKVVGRVERPGSPIPGFASEYAAFAAAKGDLAYYQILARRGEATLLTTRGELADHISAWESADDTTALAPGLVLGMEGADPIVWPEHVHDWWAAGLRVVSLTHYGVSRYAHGTGTPGGLFPAGEQLLTEMMKCGMILDVSHLADDAFWQIMDCYTGPILASHQNCRALVPGQRQFSDSQLITLLERDAIIGVAFDTWMLHPKGAAHWGEPGSLSRRECFERADVTLDNVADHIDHICQLAGSAEHVAIGADTDGQGGVDGMPYGVDTVADYQKLCPILERRGYSDTDIAAICYRNWCRFFSQWLPQ